MTVGSLHYCHCFTKIKAEETFFYVTLNLFSETFTFVLASDKKYRTFTKYPKPQKDHKYCIKSESMNENRIVQSASEELKPCFFSPWRLYN